MKTITINGATYNMTTANTKTIKRVLRAAYLNLAAEDLELVGLYSYGDVQPGWMAHRLAEFILHDYEFEGRTEATGNSLGLSYISEKMKDMPDNTILTEEETRALILETYANDFYFIQSNVPDLYFYFNDLKEEQERREAEGLDEVEHAALYGYDNESDFLASLI